ncbi:putative cytochrome b5 [Fulvia fulva]|uniref:Cytochrome b5 n=1 Tax=Passalora fulva TaxID=5499 RepID=A0A9Q8P4A9_PASFU|nr:putative cytochrome b5 [Fulvia fulva]KAK4635771.1 putative cytochrome b5 [Fulvia fulva]KAK4638448.1 putative cytochrome b5 [Fulvia fulva]UJO12778.1 putative cytochrome b5 [Fulvia fulva]WPV09346.1 putative cytochrome b5 [Fulvia fulva]WPV25190.1 putative cytochrome b5 [Fulvia fulva]
MSDTKEFTYSDVSEHTSKKDLYLVIHDKVYNSSSFVDEHPGGEEVLLDVGGQDATEAFEDVGHSDEAREILEGLLVGNLKRQEGDPAPKSAAQQVADTRKAVQAGGNGSVAVYAVILVGAAVAFFAYQYLQQSQNKS